MDLIRGVLLVVHVYLGIFGQGGKQLMV